MGDIERYSLGWTDHREGHLELRELVGSARLGESCLLLLGDLGEPRLCGARLRLDGHRLGDAIVWDLVELLKPSKTWWCQ